jgi:hypothetical protein
MNILEQMQVILKNGKKDLKLGWRANLRGQDIKKKKCILQELDELERLEEIQYFSTSDVDKKSSAARIHGNL